MYTTSNMSLISTCNLYKNQFTEIKKKKQHVHAQRSIILAQPYCVIDHKHTYTTMTGVDIYIHYTG